jgi:chromosome segregation ATPase
MAESIREQIDYLESANEGHRRAIQVNEKQMRKLQKKCSHVKEDGRSALVQLKDLKRLGRCTICGGLVPWKEG